MSLLNIWGHITTVPACSSSSAATLEFPTADTGHDTPPRHSIQTGHDIPPRHSIQTQDMTPHPFTVYRHRTWHPTPSQCTDTGHDTPPRHSIQTQDMSPHPVTVYRHRTWHPTPSQYTDTGHDTQPRHSVQTQDMTPHPVTVYRHRTWHPTPSQYTIYGRPVVVLSIDVERHTRIHNYPLYCLGSDPTGKSFLDLRHTTASAQHYEAFIVVIRRSLESVSYPPSLEPGTCGVRIHFTIHSPTAASLFNCEQRMMDLLGLFMKGECLSYLDYLLKGRWMSRKVHWFASQLIIFVVPLKKLKILYEK